MLCYLSCDMRGMGAGVPSTNPGFAEQSSTVACNAYWLWRIVCNGPNENGRIACKWVGRDCARSRMEASGPAQAFLSAPTPLHPLCGDCRAFPLCGGGCRRTREFFAAEDGYCPYQDFLYACADDLAALARRL